MDLKKNKMSKHQWCMLTSTSLNFLTIAKTYYHSNSPCYTSGILVLNNLTRLQCGSSLFSTATLHPTSLRLQSTSFLQSRINPLFSLFKPSHPTTSSSTNICFVQNYQFKESNTCAPYHLFNHFSSLFLFTN